MTARADLLTAARTMLKTLATAPDNKVILAGEKGMRPEKPYVTVRATTMGAGLGPAWRLNAKNPTDGDPEDLGTVPTVKMRERREAVISYQGYGTGSADWLDRLQIGLDLPVSLTLQRTLGIAALLQSPVRDVSALLDTAEEPRFSLELRFRHLYDSAAADQVSAGLVEVETELRRFEDDPDTLSADQSVQFP